MARARGHPFLKSPWTLSAYHLGLAIRWLQLRLTTYTYCGRPEKQKDPIDPTAYCTAAFV